MRKHTKGPWSRVGRRVIAANTQNDIAGIAKTTADADLISAAPDFLAACEGSGEDVTPLEWLAALLTDLGESNYPSTTEDPAAAWDALTHCGRLLDGLRAATRKAKGE